MPNYLISVDADTKHRLHLEKEADMTTCTYQIGA